MKGGSNIPCMDWRQQLTLTCTHNNLFLGNNNKTYWLNCRSRHIFEKETSTWNRRNLGDPRHEGGTCPRYHRFVISTRDSCLCVYSNAIKWCICACCVIHLNEMRRSIGLFASLVSKLEFVVLCASLRLGRCTVTCWLNCQLLFHRACMERYHFQIHKGFWRHRGKRKPISNRPTDKLVCVGSNRTLCTKPFSNRHLQSIKESKSPTLFILTSVFVQLRHRLYSFLFWKPSQQKINNETKSKTNGWL